MSSSIALQEGLPLSTSLEVKWDMMDSAATKSTVVGERGKDPENTYIEGAHVRPP